MSRRTTEAEIRTSGDVRNDLSACDREPIHIPGSIQPHGALLALDDSGSEPVVIQVSANAGRLLGKPVGTLLGSSLSAVFGARIGCELAADLAHLDPDGVPRMLRTSASEPGSEARLGLLAHRRAGALILECEPIEVGAPHSFENVFPLTGTVIARLQQAADIDELNARAAAEVRRLTGFDRVLIYRFDDDGHGTVVAEARNDALPSYQGHRFPASDVPAQARALYRLNRIRLIVDAAYEPVPLVPREDPRNGEPLDLSMATLRSVSPVHLEYLRNMGTAASMSISILRDGALWGLIACHHSRPKAVPFLVRATCDVLGQVFSLQLEARERQAEYEHRLELGTIRARLLEAMAIEADYLDGLIRQPDVLLDFVRAGGVAIVAEGKSHRLGQLPSPSEVQAIVAWLSREVDQDVYATASLASEMPGAEAFVDTASGLLAVAISKLYPSYVLWFRPEVARTVSWAGDPRKPSDVEPGGRIHPRKSFEMWRQNVRRTAEPFRASEIEAAGELRTAILGIVLRQAEERAALSDRLRRTNRELEAFSYSVSHDLRAPFRHIVGYSELLGDSASDRLDDRERRYLKNIGEAAEQAGLLVDHLLAFSRMGRTQLDLRPIDLNRLTVEVRDELMTEVRRNEPDREIVWKVGTLPEVTGDVMMLRLVVQNLLSNAVKFSRMRRPAVIEVASEPGEREWIVRVRDNGIGFDMAYVDKLFGVFQRLHRMEDFEGSGIGLANVQRIVSRHGGRTWAESRPDQGAAFFFSLPHKVEPGPDRSEVVDESGIR